MFYVHNENVAKVSMSELSQHHKIWKCVIIYLKKGNIKHVYFLWMWTFQHLLIRIILFWNLHDCIKCFQRPLDKPIGEHWPWVSVTLFLFQLEIDTIRIDQFDHWSVRKRPSICGQIHKRHRSKQTTKQFERNWSRIINHWRCPLVAKNPSLNGN